MNWQNVVKILFAGLLLSATVQISCAIEQNELLDNDYWFPLIKNVGGGTDNERCAIKFYPLEPETTVFLDLNYNGAFDEGEPAVLTGSYSYFYAPAGSRLISDKPIQAFFSYSKDNAGCYDDQRLYYPAAIPGTAFVVPRAGVANVVATEDNVILTIGNSPTVTLGKGEVIFQNVNSGDIISSDKPVAVTLYNYDRTHQDSSWAVTLLPFSLFDTEFWIPPTISPLVYSSISYNHQQVYLTYTDGMIEILDTQENIYQIITDQPAAAYFFFDIYALDSWASTFRHYMGASEVYPYSLLNTEYIRAGAVYITRDNTLLQIDFENDGIIDDEIALNAGDVFNPFRRLSTEHYADLETADIGHISANNPTQVSYFAAQYWSNKGEAVWAYTVNPCVPIGNKIIQGGDNSAPQIDPICDKFVNEGEAVTFPVVASDPDGEALTIVASNLPPGALFNSATSEFSWTPDYTMAGEYPGITFQVADTWGESASETITITVVNVNRAPQLEPIGDKIVKEDELLEFEIFATDPDNEDTLMYTALNLPAGAIFNDQTFSWTPGYNAAGTYEDILFEVSDSDLVDSETITITIENVNRAPVINAVVVSPDTPVQVESEVSAAITFSDPDTDDTWSLNCDWGDGSGPAVLSADQGVVTVNHQYSVPGVYMVLATVTDDDGVSDTVEYQYVVVYDPDGGFVTGGGWIDSPEGAYIPDPALTGKATFGFVSKYKKGATVPEGQTQFQFKVADLNFHSDTYQWLVIAGPRAQYKGTGTINGEGDYGFMLTAIDAELTPSCAEDKFRIKIWEIETGDTVYDNQPGVDDVDLTTEISGGSIVIHTK